MKSIRRDRPDPHRATECNEDRSLLDQAQKAAQAPHLYHRSKSEQASLIMSPADRAASIDWQRAEGALDDAGFVTLGPLLSPEECGMLQALYEDDSLFRARVIMARHGFGRGEYRYFSEAMPSLVRELRMALYAQLVPLANRWNEMMEKAPRFPDNHSAFVERCHAAGQRRPTPLMLRYGPGDYNCLHQDLYGEHVFPIQVAILLSEPGQDFEGGELVLTEQRPRMQSRVEVVPLRRGHAVAFAVSHRPVRGSRGSYRVNIRHGVSRVRAGWRHTLGIIFHDAS